MFYNNIELEVIGAAYARPELRGDVMSLDSNIFVTQAEFYKKTMRFFSGELPGFSKQEWALVIEMQKGYWCPPVIDKMIDDLRRHFVNYHIQNTRLQTEAELNQLVSKVFTLRTTSEKSPSDILWEIIEERSSGKERGINTGIKYIDQVTVGLKEGHFWIIGGYTGSGKTNLSLEIIRNVATKEKVFFFSLEMTAKDLYGRMLKREEADLNTYEAANKIANQMDLRIIQGVNKLDAIEAFIVAQTVKPKVVFIDFIQNIAGDGTEYEKLTHAALSLQNLALRENICIIALSQVSNEAAKNKSKVLGFKGSGSIAAACDVGIEIYRDDEQDEMYIDVKKNRHGRNAEITARFDKTSNRIIFDD